MRLQCLLLLLILLLCGEAQSRKCSDWKPGVLGCFEAQLTKSVICSSPPKEPRVLHTQLSVSANTTYTFYNSTISANISNYNKTYEPLSYLFCYFKKFYGYNWPFYIDCTDSNDSFVQVEYNWQTEGEIDVYVFTEDSKDGYGCDDTSVTIGINETMEVTVNISQTGVAANSSTFSNGAINITAFANISLPSGLSLNPSTATKLTDENLVDSSGSESGESGSDRKSNGSVMCDYKFFYSNASYQSYSSNHSSYKTEQNFTVGQCIIHVEVVCNDTRNSVPVMHYGTSTTNITILEPVNNGKIKFTKQVPNYNVSVEVSATGSVPIYVLWNITLKSNGSDKSSLCTANKITLNESHSEKFYCRFNESGNYKINAHFENDFNSFNKTFNISISPIPTNPAVVATTSTTVVVVSVVVILIVVSIIVFVTVYIPYRRYKNRFTETANFSFIRLQKPTKWESLKFQIQKLKDKISKRRRVGLVPKDENQLVDSFYGSLNPFAPHETL